jgi:hypothetical protein
MTPPSFAIAMILCGTVSPHLNCHKLLSASFQRATTPLLGRRLVLHDHYQWCHGDTCDTLIYQQKGPLFETGSKTRRFPPASSIYTWTIDTWACLKHTDLKLLFSMSTQQFQTNRSRIHCAISKVPGRALNLPWLDQIHHFFKTGTMGGWRKHVKLRNSLRVFTGFLRRFL